MTMFFVGRMVALPWGVAQSQWLAGLTPGPVLNLMQWKVSLVDGGCLIYTLDPKAFEEVGKVSVWFSFFFPFPFSLFFFLGRQSSTV